MVEEGDLQTIRRLLETAESNIRQVKSLLFEAELGKKAEGLVASDSGSIVEGVFEGEFMIAPDKKKYPVQANYASKSKLVPGDVLKLTIQQDGAFLFKQISPIKRLKLIGILEETERGRYCVAAEGKKYRVLLASVTYFKAKPGDQLTILVPEEGESEWAAIENKLEAVK